MVHNVASERAPLLLVPSTCWHLAAAPPVCTTSPYSVGCGGLAVIAHVMTRAIHMAQPLAARHAMQSRCSAHLLNNSTSAATTMHAEHTSTGTAVCECTPTCLLAVLAVVQPPHWRFKVMHATRELTRDGCHACAALICSRSAAARWMPRVRCPDLFSLCCCTMDATRALP
jgi:hypothetical protein